MERKTHYDRVLDYLKKYGSITSWEAIQIFGNTRLSATIYLLRKDGYNIVSDNVCTKNRFGDPVHFSKYILVDETKE